MTPDLMIKLTDWLRANKEKILEEKPTNTQLTEQFNTETNSDAKQSQLVSVKKALGIKYYAIRSTDGRYSARERCNQLGLKISELEDTILKLMEESQKILTRLNSLEAKVLHRRV